VPLEAIEQIPDPQSTQIRKSGRSYVMKKTITGIGLLSCCSAVHSFLPKWTAA